MLFENVSGLGDEDHHSLPHGGLIASVLITDYHEILLITPPWIW